MNPTTPINAKSQKTEIAKIKHAAEMRKFREKRKSGGEATPTAAQYDAFGRAFDAFNAALFGGAVPKCVLTFSRKKGARGYFAANRWEARDGSKDGIHEIALNPSAEGETPRHVASTLVHEMCHAYQEAWGKPSRSGYHNEEWSLLMESVGLQPSSTGAEGGKRVGQKMTHWIVKDGAFDLAFRALGDELFLPFREVRPEGAGGDGDGDGEGTKSKKKRVYVCVGCGSKVWGKPGMSLLCTGDEDQAHDAEQMIDADAEPAPAPAVDGDGDDVAPFAGGENGLENYLAGSAHLAGVSDDDDDDEHRSDGTRFSPKAEARNVAEMGRAMVDAWERRVGAATFGAVVVELTPEARETLEWLKAHK